MNEALFPSTSCQYWKGYRLTGNNNSYKVSCLKSFTLALSPYRNDAWQHPCRQSDAPSGKPSFIKLCIFPSSCLVVLASWSRLMALWLIRHTVLSQGFYLALMFRVTKPIVSSPNGLARQMIHSFRQLIGSVTNKGLSSFNFLNALKKSGKAIYEMTGTIIPSKSTVTKK